MITESILTELETLLVNAYKSLETQQLGQNRYGTNKRLASRLKTLIRGGGDTEIGIKSNDGAYGFNATTVGATPFTATISMTTGNLVTAIPDSGYITTVAPANITQDTPVPYSAGEGSTTLLAAAGYNTTSSQYETVLNYYDPETNTVCQKRSPIRVTSNLTNDALLDTAKLFDLPDGCVALGTSYIYSSYDSSAQVVSVCSATKDIGYYAPTSNDDAVSDLFNVVDSYDALQDTTDRSAELKNLVSAIKAHTEARSGLGFYAYWATQGHTFTPEFRALYASLYSSDISLEVGRFATDSLTPTIAIATTIIEMPCTISYAGPTTSIAATLALSGVRGAFTRVLYANASLNNVGAAPNQTEVGRRIYVEDVSTITGQEVALRDTTNTWKTIGPVSVGSAGSVASLGTHGLFVPSTAYVFNGVSTKWGTRRIGAELHPCETIYVSMPTYTASGAVLAVGTSGTKYIGVASIGGFTASPATIITINT